MVTQMFFSLNKCVKYPMINLENAIMKNKLTKQENGSTYKNKLLE